MVIQYYIRTLSCRSKLAIAFINSLIVSVRPLMAAIISAESPSCVMTDMCSMTNSETHIYSLLFYMTVNLVIHCVVCKEIKNVYIHTRQHLLEVARSVTCK